LYEANTRHNAKEGTKMDSLSAVDGVGLRQAQAQVQYQARVLAKQRDVVKGLGDAALRLIQSAVVSDPAIGSHVNLTV
jgi:hypothetical protein